MATNTPHLAKILLCEQITHTLQDKAEFVDEFTSYKAEVFDGSMFYRFEVLLTICGLKPNKGYGVATKLEGNSERHNRVDQTKVPVPADENGNISFSTGFDFVAPKFEYLTLTAYVDRKPIGSHKIPVE